MQAVQTIEQTTNKGNKTIRCRPTVHTLIAYPTHNNKEFFQTLFLTFPHSGFLEQFQDDEEQNIAGTETRVVQRTTPCSIDTRVMVH